MTYLTTVLTDQKSNLSFQKTTVTTSQDVTTSWVLVEGGQISYTPSSTTAEIMFEFSTAYARKDPDNGVMFRLQIGDTAETLGDVITGNTDYHNDFGATTTLNATTASDLVTLKYKLSGWSGEKILQIQCKTYNSSASFEARVNTNRKTESDADLLFNPFIFIYEV